MTRGYEALVILRAAGTEQDLARQATSLEEPIKRVGGQVEANQNLGRRRLAFRIRRQSEGIYHLLRFHVPPDQLRELERFFRLNEAIVRFLILTEEEAGPPGRHDGAITANTGRSMVGARS